MSIIVSDGFDDTDGVQLTSHVPTLGTSWIASGVSASSPSNFVIQSNRLQIGVTGPVSMQAWRISNSISANQFVQAEYISQSGDGDAIWYLLARATGAQATFTGYVLEVAPVGARIRLQAYVNGAYSWGSANLGAPVAGTYKVLLVGTSLKVYLNGNLIGDLTNGSVTQAGGVGFGCGASGGITNSYLFDNIIGDDTIPPELDTSINIIKAPRTDSVFAGAEWKRGDRS